MQLLIVSDVHGRMALLREVIEAHPAARTVLFLGDGLRQAQQAEEEYPDRTFYMVPGNGDFAADLPIAREETFGGKRFFFTHGHHYRVKYGLQTLELAARERQADIALFGHTHRPEEQYLDGLLLFNPGSLADGHAYGLIDVTPAGILTSLARLPD